MRFAGAVLAGGASSRMGTTKSLIEVGGIPMGGIVAAALDVGGCDPVAVIGGSTAFDRELVADRYPGEGPLGGVLTALVHFADATHVVVAACDLPFLDGPTVRRLLNAADASPRAAAVVAHPGRRDPGLVLWNRAALADISTAFEAGTRAVHRVLDALELVEQPVDPNAMRNVNRPDDVPDH